MPGPSDGDWEGEMPRGGCQLTVVAGATGFMALVLGAWVLEHTWTDRCLAASAAQAEAVVTDRHHGSGRGGPTFWLAYRFTDPAGRVRESWQRVDRTRHDATPVGTSVTALYCAGAPWRHTLDHERLRTELAGLRLAASLTAGVAAALVLLIGLMRAWQRLRVRERRADDDGIWPSTAIGVPRRR